MASLTQQKKVYTSDTIIQEKQKTKNRGKRPQEYITCQYLYNISQRKYMIHVWHDLTLQPTHRSVCRMAGDSAGTLRGFLPWVSIRGAPPMGVSFPWGSFLGILHGVSARVSMAFYQWTPTEGSSCKISPVVSRYRIIYKASYHRIPSMAPC